MSQYEIYSSGEDSPRELRDDPAPDPGGPWQVVREYSNGGQAKPPTVADVPAAQYGTRDEALAAARQDAFSFDPPDPFSPQRRQVFRDGPDGFLVIIDGAMTTFHMSVRVVQFVGDA